MQFCLMQKFYFIKGTFADHFKFCCYFRCKFYINSKSYNVFELVLKPLKLTFENQTDPFKKKIYNGRWAELATCQDKKKAGSTAGTFEAS